MTSQEAIRRGKFILDHLIGPCVNVDYHKFLLVACLDTRVYVALVILIAASRELLFAIPWL